VLAVSVFHRCGAVADFDSWAAELIASAQAAPGFRDAVTGARPGPEFDWAVAVSFDDETALHAWLDGADRARVLDAGTRRGFWLSTTDLVIDGQSSPPGVGAFRHQVATGRQDEFRRVQARLGELSAGLPGFVGTALFATADGTQLSLVRFRTAGQLADWLRSPQRQQVLGELRSSLSEEFAPVTSTTPFATTVRTENGKTVMTPNWKSAMVVLLVLYPTVMILSRFLGPVLDAAGAPPWLAMWLSQVVSVSVMTWWLMPWVSAPFGRWLDPVDGAGWRVSVLGAAVVLLGYVLTLLLFATVRYLQYWDFADR